MLKEFCGQNKKIFLSGIIIASTCFTQMPSSAFASTNTVNKHNIVAVNWQSLGENIGMGPDVLSIHNALVASPRHYQNLVDSRFTDIGIGVISQNGTIYVSQVFMQFMPVQASPPPAPTPPTTTLTAANSTGKKSVGSAQSITPPASQTTAPLATPPVAEAASFKSRTITLVS